MQKIWDVNPSIGGPIKRDKLWFHYTFRHWGTEKTKADAYVDRNPSPFIYDADTNAEGHRRRPHRQQRGPRLVGGQRQGQDLRLSRQPAEVSRPLGHRGDDSAGGGRHPGDADQLRQRRRSGRGRTPTACCSRPAFGIYNQEYTELYQPSVTGLDDKVWDSEAIRNSRVYTVLDQTNNRSANAWTSPADHFSVLRTFMGAASYVTGSHNFRFGATLTNGDWRLIEQWTGDVQPITYNAGRPVSVTLRLPMDARNGIKRDLGLFVQDRWAMGRVTLNLGLRYDQFIGETRESEVLPNRFTFTELANGVKFGECSDGKAGRGCYGEVQNWKDISPRVGFAMDVFGNGRTALKASVARYVAGQQVAVARDVNPVEALSRTDMRPWTDDLDGNGLPLDANGNLQTQRARHVDGDAARSDATSRPPPTIRKC